MTTEYDDSQIDRYLNRLMDAAESAVFEIRMLDEPVLLERVQLVEAMKLGLQQEQVSLRTTPVQTAKILPFKLWLRQPLSLAASVLMAVLLLQTLMPSLNAPGPTSIGTVLLLENSRGVLPAEFSGPPPYLFQIDVGLGNQADSFKVTLHDSNNAEVLYQEGLQADTDGWVRLVLNEALAGSYQVELAWTDTQGTAQSRNFPLEINQ